MKEVFKATVHQVLIVKRLHLDNLGSSQLSLIKDSRIYTSRTRGYPKSKRSFEDALLSAKKEHYCCVFSSARKMGESPSHSHGGESLFTALGKCGAPSGPAEEPEKRWKLGFWKLAFFDLKKDTFQIWAIGNLSISLEMGFDFFSSWNWQLTCSELMDFSFLLMRVSSRSTFAPSLNWKCLIFLAKGNASWEENRMIRETAHSKWNALRAPT